MVDNLDISFCSKTDCKNKECERNQIHLDVAKVGNHPISIANFKDCEVEK